MTASLESQVIFRFLGSAAYEPTLHAMQQHTANRTSETKDEIWFLEHPPVFTQGQNGKAEHLLNPGDIPVIQIDRGGQVTYHGPGQLMIYALIDLQRKKLTIRQFITHLLDAVIDYLRSLGITGATHQEAPGIYVGHQKICSIGLRVKHGATYHGMAFNINMDLEPFSRINPCGFSGLKMTQLSAYLEHAPSLEAVSKALVQPLMQRLRYKQHALQSS